MVKNFNKVFYTKYFYIVFFVMIYVFSSVNTTFCCTIVGRKNLNNWIQNNQIINIYNTIDNYKTALYVTKDLIRSGIPKENSQPEKQWESLIACVNEYIKKAFNKNPQDSKLKLYSKYVGDLEKIDAFLRANIRDLHEKYSSGRLNKNYLETIKKRVEANLEKTKNYFNSAYFNLVSIYPSSETKKDLKTIFPGYEVIFKTYADWKKSEYEHSKEFKLTPEKISAFLNYARILYIPKNEQNTLQGQEKAQALFDKLGKLAFKLQNQIDEQQKKVKGSWFFKKQEEEKLKKLIALNNPLINDSKEIMYSLLTTYLSNPVPHDFNFNRIYKTKDAESLIILAESGSLQEVLQALLRNINEHIQGKQ